MPDRLNVRESSGTWSTGRYSSRSSAYTIIWKGTIQSLRRFQDDAQEVAAGFECGVGLSDFQDLKEGDIIETFDEREIPRD